MERFELSTNQKLDTKLWTAYIRHTSSLDDDWKRGFFEGVMEAYLVVTELHYPEVKDALRAQYTRELDRG